MKTMNVITLLMIAALISVIAPSSANAKLSQSIDQSIDQVTALTFSAKVGVKYRVVVVLVVKARFMGTLFVDSTTTDQVSFSSSSSHFWKSSDTSILRNQASPYIIYSCPKLEGVGYITSGGCRKNAGYFETWVNISRTPAVPIYKSCTPVYPLLNTDCLHTYKMLLTDGSVTAKKSGSVTLSIAHKGSFRATCIQSGLGEGEKKNEVGTNFQVYVQKEAAGVWGNLVNSSLSSLPINYPNPCGRLGDIPLPTP